MHWLNRSISNKQVLGQVTLGQFTLGLFVFGSKLFGLNFGLTAIFWDKFLSGQISFFWDKFPYGQISLDEFSWGQITLDQITETDFQCTLNVSISSHFTGKKNLVTNRWVPQYLKKGEISHKGGNANFENFSHFFLFIFKHGLNHPEMKRYFF